MMSLINIYISSDGKEADGFVSSGVSGAPAPPAFDRQTMEEPVDESQSAPLPPAQQQESGIADWGDLGSAPEPPLESFGESGPGEYETEPVPPEEGFETAASTLDDPPTPPSVLNGGMAAEDVDGSTADITPPPPSETEEYGAGSADWDEDDHAPMPPVDHDESGEVRRETPLPPED